MGKTPSRDIPEYWNNGEHDWVSIKDLGSYEKYVGKTSETISELGRVKSGIKSVPANTLLMSFKLSLGKTAITTKETYTNEAIMAFLDKGTYDVDIDYMWHQLQSKDWTVGTNTAVMGKTLNKKTLSATKIRVPSISEQKEIAKHLDVVQETLSLLSLELKTLDDLVKSRFVEMFGDKERWASEGWPIAAVSDLICKPKSGEWGEEDLYGKGIKVLRTANFTDAGVINYTNVVTRDIDCSKLKSKGLCTGDILIEKSGGSDKKPVGRVVLFLNQNDTYLNNNFTAALRVKDPSKISYRYLFQSLYMNYWRGGTRPFESKTTGLHNLKLDGYLSKTRIPIPSIEIQQQFADFVARVDKLGFKQSLCYRATVSTSMQGVMQYYPQAIP